jgi:predicted N-acyltransferase
VPHLHFELCYYQAIEWAIVNGLSSVQAGAQGEPKLARGYEPVLTRSAHFLPNRSFRDAVATFLEGERAAIAQEMAWLAEALPYRLSSSA